MAVDPATTSREFRSLLNSVRISLEEELADRSPLAPSRRERVKAMHRNLMRLLQVANALFDLTAIELSRRVTAESVDLAAKTVIIPMLRPGDPGRPGDGSALECESAPQVIEPGLGNDPNDA